MRGYVRWFVGVLMVGGVVVFVVAATIGKQQATPVGTSSSQSTSEATAESTPAPTPSIADDEQEMCSLLHGQMTTAGCTGGQVIGGPITMPRLTPAERHAFDEQECDDLRDAAGSPRSFLNSTGRMCVVQIEP